MRFFLQFLQGKYDRILLDNILVLYWQYINKYSSLDPNTNTDRYTHHHNHHVSGSRLGFASRIDSDSTLTEGGEDSPSMKRVDSSTSIGRMSSSRSGMSGHHHHQSKYDQFYQSPEDGGGMMDTLVEGGFDGDGDGDHE